MKFINILFILSLFALPVVGQITPAPPQTQAILIEGATAHVGNGQVIQNASIAFENGVLTYVGSGTDGLVRSNYKVVDGKGKHVYPGFIAMTTTLGLVEIGAVRATRDSRETGAMNPHVRALIAYNTDSKVIPTVRSNGTLLAQACPEGGRNSGSSSLMQLDAWNWEDAVVAADEGIHLNWPTEFRRSGWWAEPGTIRKNEKYAEQVKQIEDYLVEAKAYGSAAPKETNLRMEAMKTIFSKKAKLYVHADSPKSITAAVLMSQKLDFPIAIVGGRDSWMVTDLLKEYNVPVILAQMHNLPGHADSDIDQPFKTPALLSAAGVPFVISYQDYWQVRNLAFQAGQAVAFGLDKEKAIEALTLAPAKVMGVDDSYGSLEKGKSATLFISTGDALDMRGNLVEMAYIDGRTIDLDNHHERMARKYQMKYNQR